MPVISAFRDMAGDSIKKNWIKSLQVVTINDKVMRPAFKSIAMRVPAFRKHMERVAALVVERDRLAWTVEQLTPDRDRLAKEVAELTKVAADRDRLASEVEELNRKFALLLGAKPLEDWGELKERKRRISEEIRAVASISCLTHPTE